MLLTLVRHAETIANRHGRMQGHKHSKLTELGVRQAERLARRLRSVALDCIFCSDLERAVATAAIVLEGRSVGQTPLVLDKRLRERSRGSDASVFTQGSSAVPVSVALSAALCAAPREEEVAEAAGCDSPRRQFLSLGLRARTEEHRGSEVSASESSGLTRPDDSFAGPAAHALPVTGGARGSASQERAAVGGESWDDVRARVLSFLDALNHWYGAYESQTAIQRSFESLPRSSGGTGIDGDVLSRTANGEEAEHVHRIPHVLVITHAGWLRMFVDTLFGADAYRGPACNTAVYTVVLDGHHRPLLVSCNDDSHLRSLRGRRSKPSSSLAQSGAAVGASMRPVAGANRADDATAEVSGGQMFRRTTTATLASAAPVSSSVLLSVANASGSTIVYAESMRNPTSCAQQAAALGMLVAGATESAPSELCALDLSPSDSSPSDSSPSDSSQESPPDSPLVAVRTAPLPELDHVFDATSLSPCSSASLSSDEGGESDDGVGAASCARGKDLPSRAVSLPLPSAVKSTRRAALAETLCLTSSQSAVDVLSLS